MTEFNSKALPSLDRLSIETLVLSRSVFETFAELEAFFVKKLSASEKENAAQKAKLYVSIWARLGFTVSHLVNGHLSITTVYKLFLIMTLLILQNTVYHCFICYPEVCCHKASQLSVYSSVSQRPVRGPFMVRKHSEFG